MGWRSQTNELETWQYVTVGDCIVLTLPATQSQASRKIPSRYDPMTTLPFLNRRYHLVEIPQPETTAIHPSWHASTHKVARPAPWTSIFMTKSQSERYKPLTQKRESAHLLNQTGIQSSPFEVFCFGSGGEFVEVNFPLRQEADDVKGIFDSFVSPELYKVENETMRYVSIL